MIFSSAEVAFISSMSAMMSVSSLDARFRQIAITSCPMESCLSDPSTFVTPSTV